MSGFMAWRRLLQDYNPITPAKALQSLIHLKHANGLVQMIEAWKQMWKLSKLPGEKLTETMRVAVLTSQCPPDIQDIIYQNAEHIITYRAVKEKILTLVRKRVSMYGAVPMEMGNVGLDVCGSYGR